MTDLYTYMEQYIASSFDEDRVLRKTERGEVRRIRHTQSHRLYIVRHFFGNASAYRKLLQVQCAHLPRVYEAAERNGEVLVLEEFIPGDSLHEVLKGGTLTAAEGRDISRQICDALYALHTQGLVHRDVKPENVILDGSRAVLIDFDAARERNPGKQKDTQVLGTQGYAPPEQYGISQTDETADIYATGVLLNVLLTGRHPAEELAPGRWGRIVQRCTMVSPKKRYPTVRALMEAL